MIKGLYGMPTGVDFPKELIAGLDAAYADHPPEALARLTLLVNTDRMRRRLRKLFDEGPARLLPRILTVSELADHAGLPRARAALTQRLELAHLIAKAAARGTGFAEHAQRFALADSLAALLDEIEGEGVEADRLTELDGPDQSEHWDETRAFIAIAAQYQSDLGGVAGNSGRLRRAVQTLDIALPPSNPVVLAGSTGSHGAVLDLMAALLARPNAAVVLPGFDRHIDQDGWHAIDAAPNWEDHAQARFVGLARHMGWRAHELPDHVQLWGAEPPPAVTARAKLLSLALCPAPVSDQWLSKGPELGDPTEALAEVTLLEAPTPRQEAMAIALGMRAAIEEGKRVALITPDRGLTRRVTAQLARWDITPDDSAGVPLGQTALGRLARQVAEQAKGAPDLAQVLALLKHPLCSPGPSRVAHQNATRKLELWLRQKERGLPGQAALQKWAARNDLEVWARWLAEHVLAGFDAAPHLSDWVAAHLARLDAIILGANRDGELAKLWSDEEGRAVQALFTELAVAGTDAEDAARMDYAVDYLAFFEQSLQSRELRRSGPARSDLAIWGTLEARAQGVDLTILAGLTEGTWPALPDADPWLNRALRHTAGLAAPERRVGLQAHDFQQAALAPQVWLCRPLRDDEADTIASRWLMRLTGLLAGLHMTGGPATLEAMRARGAYWLAASEKLEVPQPSEPARRACPAPPASHRPTKLSATDLQRLRRDPYAIYAKRILRLAPLSPLRPVPDAAERGNLLHRVFECALQEGLPDDTDGIIRHLLAVSDEVIGAESAWPIAQLLWQARLRRLAPSFAAAEHARPRAQSRLLERKGEITGPHGVTITAKADRIDIDAAGQGWLFDYKTGSVPGPTERELFDPQMPIMAWMLTQGAFNPPGRLSLAGMAYLHLGKEVAEHNVNLAEADGIEAQLATLLGRITAAECGFPARIMPKRTTDFGDYDHLARFGEWEMTDDAVLEVLR